MLDANVVELVFVWLLSEMKFVTFVAQYITSVVVYCYFYVLKVDS